MKRGWEELRLAGAFLTVLPVAGRVEPAPERLARSMGFFPSVGLLLGLALALADRLLGLWFPRPVGDLLLLLVLILLTGALHLDGLADLADGLAGGRDREGALRIMKDSRVGAIGVVALVMALLLKFLCLTAVPLAQKGAALLIMPAAGRGMQVALAAFSRYARPEGGTGGLFVELAGRREFALAGSTVVAAAVLLFGWVRGGALILLLAGVALLLRRYFDRRLGGVTGDVLGAASEMTEVVVLLALLALH